MDIIYKGHSSLVFIGHHSSAIKLFRNWTKFLRGLYFHFSQVKLVSVSHYDINTTFMSLSCHFHVTFMSLSCHLWLIIHYTCKISNEIQLNQSYLYLPSTFNISIHIYITYIYTRQLLTTTIYVSFLHINNYVIQTKYRIKLEYEQWVFYTFL